VCPFWRTQLSHLECYVDTLKEVFDDVGSPRIRACFALVCAYNAASLSHSRHLSRLSRHEQDIANNNSTSFLFLLRCAY
jgi:hypothetical protein